MYKIHVRERELQVRSFKSQPWRYFRFKSEDWNEREQSEYLSISTRNLCKIYPRYSFNYPGVLKSSRCYATTL